MWLTNLMSQQIDANPMKWQKNTPKNNIWKLHRTELYRITLNDRVTDLFRMFQLRKMTSIISYERRVIFNFTLPKSDVLQYIIPNRKELYECLFLINTKQWSLTNEKIFEFQYNLCHGARKCWTENYLHFAIRIILSKWKKN